MEVLIQIENAEVFNFEGAIRGMRNPLESWDKSDSAFVPECVYAEGFGGARLYPFYTGNKVYSMGIEDLKLAQKLIRSGSDHSKFMRQIFVSMDITAPLYWWKEMDTYEIATTGNSTSTMHKLATTPITRECFSFDKDLYESGNNGFFFGNAVDSVIRNCEELRKEYIKAGNIDYWRALIQLLPESWNQTRTWTADYAVLRNIYFARKNHKLSEWREFCDMIEKFPYGKELICHE